MARPRKTNVRRDKNGKSRGEEGIHPETLAVRERQLAALGVPLTYKKKEFVGGRWQEVERPTAQNQLAGFTLGILRLRQASDPGSISDAQFNAGNAFCKIVHDHAAVMGYKLTIASPSFIMVGKTGSVADPDEERVLRVREKFKNCFDVLMEQTRAHGKRVWQVTYGVCVEQWPAANLTPADYGYLRIGLNALGRVT